MIINKKSTSPGIRHSSYINYSFYIKSFFSKKNSKIFSKSYIKGFSKVNGRNNIGRITIRHRGGGHKRKYRYVDFILFRISGVGKIFTIEYDPNRTAFVSIVVFSDFSYKYILSIDGFFVGSEINFSPNFFTFHVGNVYKISIFPLGSIVCNIQKNKSIKSIFSRSAGTCGQIISKSTNTVNVKLPSGKLMLINSECVAQLGSVSNGFWNNITLGKAGRKRWIGFRPSVRGVAINPVDHPHGGGEGKTSGGRPSVSPWGKIIRSPLKKKR